MSLVQSRAQLFCHTFCFSSSYNIELVEPPCPANVWFGIVGTPQCHDVITAVGAEPFGPWGRLI